MQQWAIALFFAGCLCGLAQNVTIQNPSFESADLPLFQGYGPFCNLIQNSKLVMTNGSLANWSATANLDIRVVGINAAAGVLEPITGSGTGNWTTKWFQGSRVAYLQIGASGTVSLSQALSAKLQNNTMYTLRALIGRRVITQRFNYSIQLWAGSTLLASGDRFALVSEASATDTVSYSSGPANPRAGVPLTIVLTSSGTDGMVTEAFFDEVSLTAKPVFAVDGVVSATAFGGLPAASPGAFIEIYGSNLATNKRDWSGSDFIRGTAPTSLDGTAVAVGSQNAFVSYISPNQVNALVPSNVPTGQQPVTVTNALGRTSAFTIMVNEVAPGLLATSAFMVKGTQYAAALNSDGSYALPVGAIDGLATHPAAPGDTLVFYGLGFGPVTPSIPAGQLVTQTNTLATAFQMFIGGLPATAVYSGLAPIYTGLYQFNIVVPKVATGDAIPVTFALGGTNGTQKLFIAVQN